MIFQKKSASSLHFGLSIDNKNISLAVPKNLNFDSQSSFKLSRIQITHQEVLPKILQDTGEEYELKGTTCDIGITEEHYQIILIDRPTNTDVSEYRAAAFWQCKDMLQYPLEDCVIDVFLPSSQVELHQDKLYVIASRKSYLTMLTDNLALAEIEVSNIITEEFALRNLMSRLVSTAYTGLLIATENNHLFIIFENNDILFYRRIPANLTKELFRSLDFLTFTLKQPKLEKLYLHGITNKQLDEFTAFFKEKSYDLPFISLNHALLKYRSGDLGFQYDQLLAIGVMLNQVMEKGQ